MRRRGLDLESKTKIKLLEKMSEHQGRLRWRQSSTEMFLPVVRCGNGHELVRTNMNCLWICNGRGCQYTLHTFTSEDMHWRCQRCDYDLCSDCHHASRPRPLYRSESPISGFIAANRLDAKAAAAVRNCGENMRQELMRRKFDKKYNPSSAVMACMRKIKNKIPLRRVSRSPCRHSKSRSRSRSPVQFAAPVCVAQFDSIIDISSDDEEKILLTTDPYMQQGPVSR